MTGALVLWLGLGGLTCACLLAVQLLAGSRPRLATGAVARGLTAIERQYGPVLAPLPGPLPGQQLSPLLDRLRGIAVRLSPASVTSRLARRLDLAGNPGRWTAERVLAFKGLGLTVGVVGGLLLAAGSPIRVLFIPTIAGAAGFFLPDVLVYNTGLKRQEAIRRALPDALDLLTVCVEAGLGFDAALDEVARNSSGPLAGELSRVLREMQLGKSRADALRAVAERTSVPELAAFVTAVVQAGQLGVPVGAVLREQAAEMRVRRRQLAEERAQKVPVKILFPVIFFLMPALFVVVIGPGVLSIMRAFAGH
jgi:tight adherence protein C